MGGCDTQARQQAQQDNHHHQDAMQPDTQTHETKAPSPNTKRSKQRLQNKVPHVGKPPIAQRKTAQQTARIMAEPSRLLDFPLSHPTTQPANNTYKPNQLFYDNVFLLRNSVCLQRLSGTESTDEDRAD